MLLRGFDEVDQLLHEDGQLFYEVTASGGVAGGHKFSWKVYKTFDLSLICNNYGHVWVTVC